MDKSLSLVIGFVTAIALLVVSYAVWVSAMANVRAASAIEAMVTRSRPVANCPDCPQGRCPFNCQSDPCRPKVFPLGQVKP